MNETLGDPYAVLGLKRGASESEIRSAYRRLVKLYHPDKDASLDAQIKYREIRLAYDLLCRNPHPELSYARQAQPDRAAGQRRSFTEEDVREVFHDVFRGYGTSGSAGWQVREEEEEEGVFHVFGRRWQYMPDEEPDRKYEIPLSLGTLPTIVGESISEAFGVELLLRVCVTGGLLWMTVAPVSKLLAVLSIFFTMIGSSVFRYVRPGSVRRNMALYFLWSLYYGVGMSAVFALWNLSGFPIIRFLFHIPVFYAEILPLWIHPLAWLGEVLSDGHRRSKRGW